MSTLNINQLSTRQVYKCTLLVTLGVGVGDGGSSNCAIAYAQNGVI